MIKNIKICNFRNIPELTITPGKINTIVGKCGTGKSSILKALRYSLTGKGSNGDIMSGREEMEVTVTFDDNTEISRIRNKASNTNTVKVNGKKTTGKSVDEYLSGKLGVPMATIEKFLDIDIIQSLSDGDLTSLFLSILPATVSIDKFYEFSEEVLGRSLSAEEKTFIGSRISKDTLDLNDMNTILDNIKAESKAKKALIRELTQKSKFDDSILPQMRREDIEKRLDFIRETEAKIRIYQNNKAQYDRALAAYNQSKARLEERQKVYEQWKNVPKPDESEYTKAVSERKQFEDAIANTRQAIGVINSNISMFERTLSNLSQSMCPLSDRLVCRTDKTAIQGELNIALEQNRQALARQNDFLNRCIEQVNKRDVTLRAYNQKVVNWNNRVAIENEIRSLTSIKAPEVINMEQLPDISDKAAMENMLNIYRQKDFAMQCGINLENTKKELEFLETCMGLFAVTGVKRKIVERALAPFESMCNKKAEAFREGFSIRFTSDEVIELTFSPDGKDYLPIRLASSGEFLFITYLLISVLNEIKNVKMLIIDNLDRFDEEKTVSFLELLNADPGFENVFIAAVNHDDTVNSFKKYNMIMR